MYLGARRPSKHADKMNPVRLRLRVPRPCVIPSMHDAAVLHRAAAHLPKISTTRILTNSVEFCASESAQLLPTMPTHMLQR